MSDSSSIKIIATADNHLSPVLPRMSALRAQRRRKYLRDAFARIVSAAITDRCDMFIQAGDLFDDQSPSNEDRAFAAEQFHRLRRADIPVFTVSGNHDMPRQSTEHGYLAPLEVYQQAGLIHHFAATTLVQPVLTETNKGSVAVGGLSYHSALRYIRDPLAAAAWEDPNDLLGKARFRILVVHAEIESAFTTEESAQVIRKTSIEALPNINVLVTGHIHRFRCEKIGGVTCVVTGPSERIDAGDIPAEAGYAIIHIDGSCAVTAEHIHMEPQPQYSVELPAAELWEHNADDPAQAVIDRLEKFCGAETMLKARIYGYITPEQYRALNTQKIIRWGSARCFTFQLQLDALRIAHEKAHMPRTLGRAERTEPIRVIEQLFEDRIAKTGADAREREIWEAARDDIIKRMRSSS